MTVICLVCVTLLSAQWAGPYCSRLAPVDTFHTGHAGTGNRGKRALLSTTLMSYLPSSSSSSFPSSQLPHHLPDSSAITLRMYQLMVSHKTRNTFSYWTKTINYNCLLFRPLALWLSANLASITPNNQIYHFSAEDISTFQRQTWSSVLSWISEAEYQLLRSCPHSPHLYTAPGYCWENTPKLGKIQTNFLLFWIKMLAVKNVCIVWLALAGLFTNYSPFAGVNILIGILGMY